MNSQSNELEKLYSELDELVSTDTKVICLDLRIENKYSRLIDLIELKVNSLLEEKDKKIEELQNKLTNLENCLHNKKSVIINCKKNKNVFKSIFKHLKSVSSTITLTVDKKSFYVQAMDDLQVCLFELKLDFKWFDYYKVDKKYSLNFNSSEFCSVIDSEYDTLTFYLERIRTSLDSDGYYREDVVIETVYNSTIYEHEIEVVDKKGCDILLPPYDYVVNFVIQTKKIIDEINLLKSSNCDVLNIKFSRVKIDFGAKKETPKKENEEIKVKRATINGKLYLIDKKTNYLYDPETHCAVGIWEEKTKTILDFPDEDDEDDEDNVKLLNITMDDVTEYLYSVLDERKTEINFNIKYFKMCVTDEITNDIEISLTGELPIRITYDLGCESRYIAYLAPLK